jgi:hypothetical protein
MKPEGMLCVIPSRVGVGEEFTLKVKVLGPVRPIPCECAWNTRKPRLRGPFNLNVERGIQYLDNCLPEWTGRLVVSGGDALEGPKGLTFDGMSQGVFPGDTRPIKAFGGFRWTRPGFHFLTVSDAASGTEAWANAALVTEGPPAERIYWGDPHWQTFFSDGIRCPEELYAFARDEGFLDFGAISDHMEAVTDRQWDYFVAVTNDCNEPGRFATLVGQEWTKHNPGHRNVYYRGDAGPVLRSNDPRYDSLDKLWAALDALERNGIPCLAIPHHTANKIMGVDWSAGWNPRYEKAVEIYSVWGSSECHADCGNTRPLRHCDGEVHGRHVVDALKMGYRLGFVGGGDIHDGRPGDDMHTNGSHPAHDEIYPQGFTAASMRALTRADLFDALRDRRTYATTRSRIYLEASDITEGNARRLAVRAASEQGIRHVIVVRNGEESERLTPADDPRVVEASVGLDGMAADEFCYVRVLTEGSEMAWSSPVWGAKQKAPAL